MQRKKIFVVDHWFIVYGYLGDSVKRLSSNESFDMDSENTSHIISTVIKIICRDREFNFLKIKSQYGIFKKMEMIMQ